MNTAHVMRSPEGRYHLVGRVPAAAGYVGPNGEPLTDQQAAAACHVGPRIAGVKDRTYATPAAAIAAVLDAGGTICRSTTCGCDNE
jgi:hypothetical protein